MLGITHSLHNTRVINSQSASILCPIDRKLLQEYWIKVGKAAFNGHSTAAGTCVSMM